VAIWSLRRDQTGNQDQGNEKGSGKG
jgi:hypothetical protein